MDSISRITVSLVILPLTHLISDAKVMTDKQAPLKDVSLLIAELETREGYTGLGFGYVLRSGGKAQYAHAKELAPFLIGEDPNDIPRLWEHLAWQGASVGRCGVAIQAIAAFDIALWDLKAKRAGIPLSKLLGAHRDSVSCYNTSGGYYGAPIAEVCANAERSLDNGIGGVKLKVGQPDVRADIARVMALRRHLGDSVPIMVDANQQWDRPMALYFGRAVDELGLTWIEEPLAANDVEGHAMLSATLDTPIATGEMLTTVAEHERLVDMRAIAFVQPDAPRIGGITPFLDVAAVANRAGLKLAPHFVMELHLPLCATYPSEPWVEHFEWLEPLFEERLEIRDGRMIIPDRPGLGLSLSERARYYTQSSEVFC